MRKVRHWKTRWIEIVRFLAVKRFMKTKEETEQQNLAQYGGEHFDPRFLEVRT